MAHDIEQDSLAESAGEEGTETLVVPVPMVQTGAPAQVMADPELIVANATRASRALMKMIEAHGPKFLSQIRGNPYPKFEAWQMIGAFFTCTAAVESVGEIVENDGTVVGFECWAIVVDANGIQKGRARAVCMVDESSWQGWPPGDLANAVQSKAQTRAQAKALRGMFAWVAALGGLEVTPAEEMELVPEATRSQQPSSRRPPTRATSPPPPQSEKPGTTSPRRVSTSQGSRGESSSQDRSQNDPQPPSRGNGGGEKASEKQRNFTHVLMGKLDSEFAAAGLTEDDVWDYFRGKAQVESRNDFTRKHASQIIDGLTGMLDEDVLPMDIEVAGFVDRVKAWQAEQAPPPEPEPEPTATYDQGDIPF